MKEYPSIEGVSKISTRPCIAFYKYDGSNLRFEWRRKIGWNKQGTRNRLFDITDPIFGQAIDIFHSFLASRIEEVIKKKFTNVEVVTAFVEFFGEKFFAGVHVPDDRFKLVLFDIHIHRKGILGPREFVSLFGHLDSAKVVYEGNLNKDFIDKVRNNKLATVLNEGVVCKGGREHKLWMCKIKTDEYKEKLKERFSGDWKNIGNRKEIK